MVHALAICLSLLGADDVTVKPLHGDAVRGSLIQLSEKSVVVRTAAGEKTWESGAVHSVKTQSAYPAGFSENSPSGPFIELIDDSVLLGSHFKLESGNAEFQFPNGQTLKVAGRIVRGVRLRKQDEMLRRQWQMIAEADASGDRLVIRKTGEENPDAGASTVVLDQLEGVVHAVGAKTISFEYDGDRIEVPLEKVEGILFHYRKPEVDPVCRVRDAQGAEWHVRTLQFAEGKITLQTVAGAQAELRLSQIAEVDFSSGNLTYLSDLKEESFDWRPYLVTPATPPALAKWFSLRRDQTTDGSILMLGGQPFDKGLSVHSRTLITYRLTRDYRHLQAVVGIDEKFRGPGNLKLEITGDNRQLFAKDIRGTDRPFEIDLDVSGVRRLKILVDFGEDRSDAGDHLLLCNARLTK
jgi:hypothetical protein